MLNNVVLDVAIGLIFIFMLYSLFATTLQEFIATIFSYRSRMLERGIEQMIDGRNFSYYWWEKVANKILFLLQYTKIKIDPNRNVPEDADKKIWRKKWEQFKSRGMINQVKTFERQKNDTNYIIRSKLNKKAELFTVNVTTHALYKRSAENSLFYKKPAYLSADTFSDILLDILSQKKSTSPGVPVLMKDIAAFVNAKLDNNPELKKILNIYIEQANGDLQRFKLLTENWYDATMERVSGWYKKQSMRILLGIGLVLAFVFNVSTIDIIEKLSTDETVREAVVKNASDYVKSRVEPEVIITDKGKQNQKVDTTEKSDTTKKAEATSKTDIAKEQKTEPASGTARSNEKDKKDSLFADAKKYMEEINKLYKESLDSNNNLLGLGWGNYGYTEDTFQFKKDSILFKTDRAAYCDKYSSFFRKCKAPARPGKPNWVGKLLYIMGESLSDWKRLIGFIITAFAISLGAPFWFDLLNKFMNMRVSGAKPDEAKKSAGASKTTGLNQSTAIPNPKSFG
ncbi:MAG: hypothetical protein ABI675_19695 [Chitinophagaceae bacterium]